MDYIYGQGLIIENLISQWKQISKLIFGSDFDPDIDLLLDSDLNPYEEYIDFFEDHFLDSLNDLESLETLVIFVSGEYHDFGVSLRYQPFVHRLKHLFVPSIKWLEGVKECSKLTSLGFNKIPKEASEMWFGKLEDLYFSVCCYFGRLNNWKKLLHFLRHFLNFQWRTM